MFNIEKKIIQISNVPTSIMARIYDAKYSKFQKTILDMYTVNNLGYIHGGLRPFPTTSIY